LLKTSKVRISVFEVISFLAAIFNFRAACEKSGYSPVYTSNGTQMMFRRNSNQSSLSLFLL